MTDKVSTFLQGFFRALGVAVLTTVIILAGLTLAYRGQAANDVRLRQAALDANVAIVCVLALPVDPVKGRDEDRMNSVCLVPHGIDAFDVNGDGVVEGGP